ncbi:MAG: 30S ribosomal protein S2 [candidate division WS2 bacterium ADurb.Bin280]|uniref:Small ribosomal subunit protein uS2 n=1 Tax=candidate division WS2 bacterium ADurb.Bin280 TaxID=1852829 RepID=A0A1V5SEN9_9BACT|nr:MAG: 30S ribosomal protein S2 [candidate division WS2 bacterium ADurb.Bin280]
MSVKIPTVKELFKAGAHYGHHRERTDARTHSYVFTYKNKISIINLEKTREMLEEAARLIEEVASKGGKFLFVGSKFQVKDKIEKVAQETGSPYVIERWPGGLLTNFQEVSKSIKKMIKTQDDIAQNKYEHLTKRERLEIEKNLKKTETIFGGLKNLDRKPDLIVIVDAKEEMNALLEAKKAGVKVVALCDTNANPKIVDYPVILNDDSKATLEMVLNLFKDAIKANFKQIKTEEEGAESKEKEDSGKKESEAKEEAVPSKQDDKTTEGKKDKKI